MDIIATTFAIGAMVVLGLAWIAGSQPQAKYVPVRVRRRRQG
ncbi:hypothetical protein ACFSM5_07190 [Lacibacterium aquatile]|uniref:Uncharacterized protein n=1 Tax=Lacibacterium aquatile TaxID=1168082 RepID=A0ABW5DQ51_9PROT